MPHRDSTVRGREFGEGVREAIRRAGLSGRAAAKMVGWDQAKMSSLVNGKGGVTELELAHLLGVCRTSPEEHVHLMELFHETTLKGWLQLYGDKLPVQVRTLVEHETAAIEIIDWSAILIPGLLQTPDYMRAMILVWPTVPEGETEERVAARVAMQEILERRRKFTFYVHECALRLPVGGPDVMADQLHHLLRMSVRPYITLRIVPTAIGAHAGTTGSFTKMKFRRIEPVVYVESQTSSLFLEDKASVVVYGKVLESLDRTALDEEQSRKLITEIVT